MRIEVLPTITGWYWLRDGFKLLSKRPGLIPSFMFFAILTFLVIIPIRFFGPLIITMLIPCFFMVMFHACSQLDAKEEYFLDLKAAFNSRLWQLMTIGLIYYVLAWFFLWVTTFVDDGALAKFLMSRGTQIPEMQQPNSHEYYAFIMKISQLPSTRLFVALMVAGVVLFWFVPPLVCWRGFGISKALFFNYYALRHNWQPFMLYGFCLIFSSQALGFLMLVMPEIIGLILVPLLFLSLMALCMASIYTSYQQIFVETLVFPPVDNENDARG